MNFGWKSYKDSRGEWRWSFLFKGKTLFKADKGYRDTGKFKEILYTLISYDTTTELSKSRRGTPFIRIIAPGKEGNDILGIEHPRKNRDTLVVNIGLDIMKQYPASMIETFFANAKRCMRKI